MASDSQTATATMSEKPLENKVKEESSLMEKEIVLEETVDVVNDKLVSDSNLTVEKEEKVDQTPAGEPEKEEPVDVVEEVAAVVKADESMDKEKDEKVAEQMELKEGVAEVSVEAVDGEKAEEGKGKDENGEEKVASEQVELKEPTLVKESVEEVKIEAEEKLAMESVAEEDNKDKEEEKKMVDVFESTDEAGSKQVVPVDVQLVREVSEETVGDKIKDAEVLEVEPKIEVVRTEEPTVQAEVELEGKLEDSIVETKDSKDEQTSESGSALCPKETVPINQDSDTAPKNETEGEASSLPDVIEKTITEEKQVVEEPSKDEKEKVSEEAKDVVTKLATEDENIKKDTETPAADVQSEETLKETEGTKQEESITKKVSEVVEVSDELKQEPEVTTKEVKHSRSIMSKVKQSLVKAKKAIIGKSPSSKTISTEETKEEVIAK
ncbi:hypothetical protein YC2023_038220 [Brassica napus]